MESVSYHGQASHVLYFQRQVCRIIINCRQKIQFQRYPHATLTSETAQHTSQKKTNILSEKGRKFYLY